MTSRGVVGKAAAAAMVVVAAVACSSSGSTGKKVAGTDAPGKSADTVAVSFSVAAGTPARAIEDAAVVVRKRVAADHLAGVGVKVDGGKLVLTGPSADRARLELLGAVGNLWFRVVVDQRDRTTSGRSPSDYSLLSPARPAANGAVRQTLPDAATLQLFQAVDCTNPPPTLGAAPAQDYAVGCSLDKSIVYLLAPADVAGSDITSVAARQALTSSGISTDTWQVDLSFTSKGAKNFSDVTGELYQNGGEFAVTLDGVVYSAPTVSQGPIVDGSAQITGNFSKQTASDLASVLQAGALPVALHLDQ